MLTRLLPLLCLLIALAGCSAQYLVGQEPLVSTLSPPAPWSANAEPEPLNSLPPGMAGQPVQGPTATWPNFASINLY